MMQHVRPVWMLIAGSVLLLVAMAILATNESNVLTYRHAAARHGGVVINASGSGPSRRNNGHMVLVAGTPHIVKPPDDHQFGVTAQVPILWRVTEMFQWREIDLGGDIHYELEWVDHPVDWTVFKHRSHHHNPAALPFGSARFVAPLVRLDGFKLAPELVNAMPGRKPLKPDFSRLRPNMAASFRVVGDQLLTSKETDSPQLGDLRVTWQGAPLQPITVIARNQDGTLQPAVEAEDGRGFEVQVGQREVVELQPDLPPMPLLPWLWRILSVLIATAGAFVLLRGVSAVHARKTWAGLIAGVGIGVTVVCGLAGVMWIVRTPVAGGALIVVAALGLAGTAWLLYERTA